MATLTSYRNMFSPDQVDQFTDRFSFRIFFASTTRITTNDSDKEDLSFSNKARAKVSITFFSIIMALLRSHIKKQYRKIDLDKLDGNTYSNVFMSYPEMLVGLDKIKQDFRRNDDVPAWIIKDMTSIIEKTIDTLVQIVHDFEHHYAKDVLGDDQFTHVSLIEHASEKPRSHSYVL
jgi:hypothetical protein